MSGMSPNTLVPPPDIPSEPNFGNLLIIDDVLYPKGGKGYVGREAHIHIALFVISQVLPIVSATLIVFSRKGWWRMKYYWTMSRLVVLWLISIQIVAVIVFFQTGATDRITFLSAALHLQIEYMIIALLLKSSALTALIIAYIGGTLLYLVALFVKDLSVAYILTTTLGFTDFMIPLLLAYGKQWLFAAGGFAHLIQAASLFAAIVKNYGHIQNSFLTFISTWIMNGLLVAAIFQRNPPRGNIRLSDHDSSTTDACTPVCVGGGADDNPLADVKLPPQTVVLLFAISIAAAFSSSLIFTFIVARS